MLPTGLLQSAAAEYGISLSEEMLRLFSDYASLLVAWNENVNLTAITDGEGIAVRHFLDSLLLLPALSPKEGASLIDVGCGAGFPSLPLKIARGDLRVTLLDSLGKRVRFLEELCGRLALPAACFHLRAEEGAKRPELREAFDYATARAVAALPALCELCLPFVSVGGTFAAMKGPGAPEELEAAGGAIRLLGGEVEGVREFTLPDESRRNVILIRKISHTPPKYPRAFAKISKSPLR